MALLLIWNERTTGSKVYGLITLTISLFYEGILLWAKGFVGSDQFNILRGIVGYFSETMNIIDLLGYTAGIVWIISYNKKSNVVRDTIEAHDSSQDEIDAYIDQETTKLMRE